MCEACGQEIKKMQKRGQNMCACQVPMCFFCVLFQRAIQHCCIFHLPLSENEVSLKISLLK